MTTSPATPTPVSAVATVVEFTLPVGYEDPAQPGVLHREGRMRLATAADEILPLRDPRVQANPAYLSVIVLSRVVVALGEVEAVTPKVVEGLFAADLTFLQDLYDSVNGAAGPADDGTTVCPRCEHRFRAGGDPPGKSGSTPPTGSPTSWPSSEWGWAGRTRTCSASSTGSAAGGPTGPVR